MALCGAALFWSVHAQAQVASQITPQSFAPPIQGGLGGGIDVGAQPGLDTPPGAERLFVTLRRVTVEGGIAALAAKTEEICTRLTGHKLSGAEIFAVARELEAVYATAGYVLVRVTLPQQKLVNGGALRLVVIDGFVERIEVKNVPDPVRTRIAALLAPLTGVHGLTKRDLERQILLAGDVPGVILASTLAAGSATGATILVIEAKYQPVSGVLNLDNSLSRTLGTWQLGGGFDFNSVFGFGELAYLRATGDPNSGLNGFLSDNPRNRSLAAGFIVPLGIDGLTFNAEASLARTTPLASGGLASQDHFERYSARLRYPWLRSRDANVSSQLVLDVQDEQENAYLGMVGTIGTPLFIDRVRVLRLVNEADYLASWGATLSGSLTPSVGIDVLGARTLADATASGIPLSTLGANANFAKLAGTLGYRQPIAEHLVVTLSGLAQTSFGAALVRSEQIGIAGPTALSAFDAGTLQGDSGYTGRGELSAPFNLPPLFDPIDVSGVGLVAAPYVFAAGGEVFLSHPTALEAGHIRAASVGAGLRLGGAQAGSLSNGSLSLEYGREARSDGMPDGNRFTLVSAMRF